MNPIEQFNTEKKERIQEFKEDKGFREISRKWVDESYKKKYVYNFNWLGRPIIQYPQDILGMQEIIWEVKPDLIIETGIAHGGSIIFSASMLEILGEGEVIGIDIDIREHNRREIENHLMYKRITMIEGSSVSEKIIEQIREFAKDKKRVMVFLDSNHTHKHVLKELNLYSEFVTAGSYLVALDTYVEDLPEEFHTDRPWSTTDNPKTAVKEFLQRNSKFIVDEEMENKLMITSAPMGFLRRVK